MHTKFLLALPLLAAVQAEQVCKVVTKTVTGPPSWNPTQVGEGQHQGWLPVGHGDQWSEDGKPGPVNGGDGHDGHPGHGSGEPGHDDEPGHGGKPPHEGGPDGGHNGSHDGGHDGGHDGSHGTKPPQGPSTTTTTTSKHGGPGKPSSTTATTSHGGPGKPSFTTTSTHGGPKTTTTTTSSTKSVPSSTTKHNWSDWVGSDGGVLCTATSTEYTATTEETSTTITPEASTTISTILETATITETAKGVTDIFSSTTTIIVVETINEIFTDISTILETALVTGAPTTTTIAAVAGFTPIHSMYPESGRTPEPEDEPEPALFRRNGTAAAVGAIHILDANLPSCTATTTSVATETNTIHLTSTITAPAATITAFTTETLTSTSSVAGPNVTDTLTITTHSTTQTTLTSTLATSTTATTTETVVSGPIPTIYAACAAENILTNYQGQQIEAVGPNAVMSLGYGADAYDCCKQCIEMDGGAGCASVARDATGICFFAKPAAAGVCDGSSQAAMFGLARLTKGFQLMNGGCGRWHLGY